MLVLISPAKSLNFEPLDAALRAHLDAVSPELPQFEAQAQALVNIMRKKSAKSVAEMMDLSPALAELNVTRFKSFLPTETAKLQALTKPAVLAFDGDVYDGLLASTLDKYVLVNAAQSLRILSGLYGVLHPLDALQPYRLEMGRSLAIKKNITNLYGFWGDVVTQAINQVVAETGAQFVLNAASQEYFKVIQVKKLSVPVIECVFEDQKVGEPNSPYKISSFFAKRARGMMARFVLLNKPKTAKDLQAFCADNYAYQPAVSTELKLVFRRAARK